MIQLGSGPQIVPYTNGEEGNDGNHATQIKATPLGRVHTFIHGIHEYMNT